MTRPNVNVTVGGPKKPTNYTYKTVVLKSNLPFAAQVTEPNCIYTIKWDFDLGGETVTIPENCVPKFEGGSLKNGTIVGQNTNIDAGLVKIFEEDVTLTGSWDIAESYPEWFGAIADSETDCSTAAQKCIDNFPNSVVTFSNGEYGVGSPLKTEIHKFDNTSIKVLSSACIKAISAMEAVLIIGDTYEQKGYPRTKGKQTRVNGGGTIDANSLAETCIWLKNMFNPVVSSLQLIGFRTYGIKCSTPNPDDTFVAYEGYIYDIQMSRETVDASIVGTDGYKGTGLWVNGNDMFIKDVRMVNCQIGIHNFGSTFFRNIHAVVHPAMIKDSIFVMDDTRGVRIGATYDTCYSDNYQIGYKAFGDKLRIFNSVWFNYMTAAQASENDITFQRAIDLSSAREGIILELDNIDFTNLKSIGAVNTSYIYLGGMVPTLYRKWKISGIYNNQMSQMDFFNGTYYSNVDSGYYVDKVDGEESQTKIHILGTLVFLENTNDDLNYSLELRARNIYDNFTINYGIEGKVSKNGVDWDTSHFTHFAEGKNSEGYDTPMIIAHQMYPYDFTDSGDTAEGVQVHHYRPRLVLAAYFKGAPEGMSWKFECKYDTDGQCIFIPAARNATVNVPDPDSPGDAYSGQQAKALPEYADSWIRGFGATKIGAGYFLKDINKKLYYNGTQWKESDGCSAGMPKRDTLAHIMAYLKRDIYIGYKCICSDLQNRPFWALWADDDESDTAKWVEADGAKAGVTRSGTFNNKPLADNIYIGFRYFCTDKQTVEGATDGIEIIHKGNNVWVDALGRVVS